MTVQRPSAAYRWLYKMWSGFRSVLYFSWLRQLYFRGIYNEKLTGLKFVVIYGQGRTGSTLLANALAAHESVCYDQEVLRRPLMHYKSFVQGQAKKMGKDIWYVLKVKPMHLNRLGLSLGGMLRSLGGHQVVLIHLARHNHFEHAISKIIASERNEYAQKIMGKKVHINVQYLKDKIDELSNNLQHERDEMKGMEFSGLTYEGDLASAEALELTLNSILEKLGLTRGGQIPKSKKVLSTNLADEILNWEEVKMLADEKA